ncbi:hypothetical protein SAY87_032120 [Trapa incisa]|uniref:RING-type domain-containing protein n=1 Tax=Trapa incisa TaxID=236973 RepID=A0AAN7QP15_9MYRT|nr:hypothetical protein SAY87_032120 [Trapa incisa]
MSKEKERQEQEQEQESGCSIASTSGGNANPCPICLGPIPSHQESYLDRCFHKFCYECIVQWIKFAPKKYSEPPDYVTCPYCKTENSSVIYLYDENSLERHYIPQIYTDSVFLSEAHKYRLRSYYTRQGSMQAIFLQLLFILLPDKLMFDVHSGTLDGTFDVQRFWRLRKYLHQNQSFRSWVKRELQALLLEEDVEVIAHHILGTVEFFVKRNGPKNRKQPEVVQEEFRAIVSEAARPFLAGKTERFVQEMELFLASGLKLEAYDEVYKQQACNDTVAQPSETSRAAPDLFIFDDTSHEAD